MPDENLSALIEKLLDAPDPKARRSAAKQLGVLKNPDAISFLVQAFHNDADPGVQQAARDALLLYRRMEYESRGEKPPQGAGSGGDISPALLTRLRGILTILLVVTLVANGGIFLAKNLLNRSGVDVVLEQPTPREELTQDYEARLKQIKTELEMPVAAEPKSKLYSLFTEFQAEVETLNTIPRCRTLDSTQVTEFKVAAINEFTYPDLGRAGQDLSAAAKEYLSIRTAYTDFCQIKDLDQLKRELEKFPGGTRTLVQRHDELSKVLVRVGDLLRVSRESPLPTRGPTVTPTPQPTETSAPTSTAERAAVQPTGETPVSTSASVEATVKSGTPLPTETPAPTNTPEPTATSIPSPTPIPPFKYAGLGLERASKYQYRYSVSYDGVNKTNDPIRGSISLAVIRQNEPLKAQYDVSIRDSQSILVAQNYLPPRLNVPNQFVILNGAILELDVATNRCASGAVSGDTLAPFNDPGFDRYFVPSELQGGSLDAVGMTLVETIGNLATYRATPEVEMPDKVKYKYQIEIKVYTDSGVVASYNLNRTAEPPAGYTQVLLTSFRIEYILLGLNEVVNADQFVTVPLACR